jgi:homoserine O-acetyltransferase
MRFPVFSVRDMVKAQHEALKIIGIEKLECVIGGSLGGMQALEWAVMFPEAVKRSVVIAAPAFTYPQAIAFNEVQRQAIMADPQWRRGDYYDSAPPERGLAIARMLAMITYRSEETFVKRYMRELAFGAPWDWDGKFKIETYIHHHGEKLVQRFDANCYLYLTRAMDLHDIGEGRGGVKKALSMIGGQLLAVGISSDLLFPNWQVEGIVSEAREAGVEAFYDEIESDNGHDAFLIDLDQLDDILRGFWKRTMLY